MTVQRVVSKKFCTLTSGFRAGLPCVQSEMVHFMGKLHCKYVFLWHFVTFKRVLDDHDLTYDLQFCYFLHTSQKSAVSIQFGYKLKVTGYKSRQKQKIYSSPKRPYWLRCPPIQWVPGPPSLLVKRPASKAGHSPPFHIVIRNECVYIPAPDRNFKFNS